MTERAPVRTIPETINTPEGLPPRDEAINILRDEIQTIKTLLNEAKENVRAPGVRASANDIIAARAHLREVRENDEPRLNGLVEMWEELGGQEVADAEEAVAALNFRSTASDRVKVTARLRDAKNSFYANLQNAVLEQNADATRFNDVDEAHAEALADKTRIHDPNEAYAEALADQQDTGVDATPGSAEPEGDREEPDGKWVDPRDPFSSAQHPDEPVRFGGDVVPPTPADLHGSREPGDGDAVPEQPAGFVPFPINLVVPPTPADLHGSREPVGWGAVPIEPEAIVAARPTADMPISPQVRLHGMFVDLKGRLKGSRVGEWLTGSENKRNRIVAVAVGTVALISIAVLAHRYGIFGWLDGDNQIAERPSAADAVVDNVPDISGGFESAADTVHTHTVHSGDGWLELLQREGFSNQEAWAKLPKILAASDNPEIAKWVYEMPDGNPGISHTGQMPASVLNLIKNL